jgi:hypothetical protein
MKVIIGNGIDAIEAEFETQGEVTGFLQGNAVILKQALKALAISVPNTVEYRNQPETNTTAKTVEPPYQPKRTQGQETEVCPKCGNKTLYTNVTAAQKKCKDGTFVPNPNAGKRYKSCKCQYWAPIDDFVGRR